MKTAYFSAGILTISLMLHGCGTALTKNASHSTTAAESPSTIEQVSDSGELSPNPSANPQQKIQTAHSHAQTAQPHAQTATGLHYEKRIRVIGNIGGTYSVNNSQWRLVGAAISNSTHQHVIAYPTDPRVVTHDPAVIKEIQNIRSLDEVIWKLY